MPIVELIPSLTVGGAERVVTLLSLALRAEGAAVTVVSLGGPTGSWLEGELARGGVPVRFLGKGPGFEPRIVPRLALALARLRPRVVHTHLHTLKYLLPAHVSAPRSAIVHTLHNLALREATPADRRLQQLAFRLGVVPVSIGDAVSESFRAVYRLPAPAQIPNGIPVATYARPETPRDTLRARLGVGPDTPVLLSVGRLNAQKDPLALVEAFADPRLRALGARLWIAGEGELRDEVLALVRRAGLEDVVTLLGVRSDVPDLLAAADVFVLPSRYEGNPLVVMEAMAAGRPVVATAVGCLPELVSEETGRLVRAGDGAGLSAAMVALAGDPPLARHLGAAAAAAALARFDVQVMARVYRALFARLRPEAARSASGVSEAPTSPSGA